MRFFVSFIVRALTPTPPRRFFPKDQLKKIPEDIRAVYYPRKGNVDASSEQKDDKP